MIGKRSRHKIWFIGAIPFRQQDWIESNGEAILSPRLSAARCSGHQKTTTGLDAAASGQFCRINRRLLKKRTHRFENRSLSAY
jgi:hypothetical protein